MRRPSLVWETMAVENMKYEDEFFDIVIDKSTIDCLVCCHDSTYLVARTMKECQRVLKPGGLFISISFTAPNMRLPHFRRSFLDFKIRIHEIFKEHYMGEITNHYVYILEKGSEANQKVADFWPHIEQQMAYAQKLHEQI